jgi:hypothetical protein
MLGPFDTVDEFGDRVQIHAGTKAEVRCCHPERRWRSRALRLEAAP